MSHAAGKLPPNLQALADLLAREPHAPAFDGLRRELAFVAERIGPVAHAPAPGANAPAAAAAQLLREGMLGMTVGSGSGGGLVPCPLGCGRMVRKP